MNADLLGRTVQFLQTILQPRHVCLKLGMLQGKQVLVEFDLLKETLRSRVVVAAVVAKVERADVVDRHVDVRHELGHGYTHLRLKTQLILSKITVN